MDRSNVSTDGYRGGAGAVAFTASRSRSDRDVGSATSVSVGRAGN